MPKFRISVQQKTKFTSKAWSDSNQWNQQKRQLAKICRQAQTNFDFWKKKKQWSKRFDTKEKEKKSKIIAVNSINSIVKEQALRSDYSLQKP